MPIYKHDCEECKYLGSETLHNKPVDIYYCAASIPYPSILVRRGDEEHEYSSIDTFSLQVLARQDGLGNKTNMLMYQYYCKQLIGKGV